MNKTAHDSTFWQVVYKSIREIVPLYFLPLTLSLRIIHRIYQWIKTFLSAALSVFQLLQKYPLNLLIGWLQPIYKDDDHEIIEIIYQKKEEEYRYLTRKESVIRDRIYQEKIAFTVSEHLKIEVNTINLRSNISISSLLKSPRNMFPRND